MMNNFDVTSVSLNDKILVEASAGTGKTYSISILVLRLIIEKDINISKMLIVTYTNDAVAELQDRIRKFLYQSYRYLNNNIVPIDADENIIRIIDDIPLDKAVKLTRIKNAYLLLDEAKIMTIHGFAQQSLKEFAFETGQDFGTELVTSIDDITNEIINEFWRKEITLLPDDIIELIGPLDTLRKKITKFTNAVLNGKEYYPFVIEDWNEKSTQSLKELIQEQDTLLEKSYNDLYTYIDNRKEQINDIFINGKKIKDLQKAFDISTDALIEKLKYGYEKNRNYYSIFIETYLPEIEAPFLSYITALYKIDNSLLARNFLYFKLQQIYIPQIKKWVRDARLLTFDDMIVNLHKSIVIKKDQNSSLIEAIRNQYDAIFIDEFQDTDSIQFEIFQTLFINDVFNKTVFLIGDPKQSIYAFRGADVDSYLDAKAVLDSENMLTINTNYRSSTTMIAAVNKFYSGHDFNVFGYDDNSKIDYQEVAAKEEHKLSIQDPLLNFFLFPNKNTMPQDVANYISKQLGDPNVTIDNRRLKPSDCCILVRTKSEGREIIPYLTALNIPSVMIDESTVLNTEEAAGVIRILTAILDPNIKNIKHALFLSFLNYNIDLIESLSEQDIIALINQFLNYKNILEEDGIYAAFERLLHDYNLNWKMAQHTSNLRIITNVRQIIEIANEQQINGNMSARELLTWLITQLNNEDKSQDSYQLQLESDQDAVQVTTIHKSKGLEYNWVIVLGLSSELSERQSAIFTDFKLGNDKMFTEYKTLGYNEDIFLEQLNQELRRLLYVAITRAKYKCDFFVSTKTLPKSTLGDFEERITHEFSIPFNIYEGIEFINSDKEIITTKDIPEFHNPDANWRKLSFSTLSAHHQWEQLLSETASEDDYDLFVFDTIGRGMQLGDYLHKFLEKISFQLDYSDDKKLDYGSLKLVNNFNKFISKNEKVDNGIHIRHLLHHILNTTINIGEESFYLAQVPDNKRVIEVSFHFDIDGNLQAIENILSQYYFPYEWKSIPSFYGMMNGIIDLLFEYEGKYYILDWKSNYLGNHQSAYSKENVAEAMEINGYHLQYLLYTVATHKFLESRLKNYNYNKDFGGVIYLFVRGMRVGKEYGIFTTKPDEMLVKSLAQALR